MHEELINNTIEKINEHVIAYLADDTIEPHAKAELLDSCSGYIHTISHLGPSPADKMAEGFPVLASNVLELMLRHAPPPAARKPRAKTARKATRRKTR